MKSHKKIAIFDFDGTIVDSMEELASLAAELLPRFYDVDQQTARRRYLETSGLPFREQLETLFPKDPANDRVARDFEKRKRESYMHRPLFTDASATIASLRAKKMKIAISSSNIQDLIDQFLKHANIHIDLALGWRPNFTKGEDHFSYIAAELGSSRSEMIFIGDSIHDGERAETSGVDFIGKAGTVSLDDFRMRFPKVNIIHHLADLTKLL